MSNSPKYEKIKQEIYQQIQNKTLLPGRKLASEGEYAQLYGVSTITVRKALSELADEGHIRRIKGKGSFVEDPSNATGSSRLIALVISSEYYQDTSVLRIIKGAQKALSDHDYALIVEWNEDGLAAELAIIQKMIAQKVAGFLIYPFDPVPSVANYQLIERHGLPYVLIDRYDPNHRTCFAGCDNYNGAILATKELIRLKHTKIRFACLHFFLSSEQERYDGYCNAMRQAGLNARPQGPLANIDYDSLAEEISARKTTAIVCCNDKLAIQAIRSLTARGIRVPEDVSIFGFDDWIGSAQSPVSLSTLRQRFEEEGGNASILLINAIQGRFDGNDVKMLSGVELVLRDSVCENLWAES